MPNNHIGNLESPVSRHVTSPSPFTSLLPLLPGISFIPREVGEHQVSILKNGRHVVNSPITIMVVQSEIGDASRVRAQGDGLVQGTTFTDASFVVDTQEAGRYRGGGHSGGGRAVVFHVAVCVCV